MLSNESIQSDISDLMYIGIQWNFWTIYEIIDIFIRPFFPVSLPIALCSMHNSILISVLTFKIRLDDINYVQSGFIQSSNSRVMSQARGYSIIIIIVDIRFFFRSFGLWSILIVEYL